MTKHNYRQKEAKIKQKKTTKNPNKAKWEQHSANEYLRLQSVLVAPSTLS